ncbi:MAG TPA: DUF1203 domain-containing protein [Rhodanobacteraceae bacterium]|nr:DUF1203 domain-containing protein [Rhodanobacteraceae bacterium]
MAYSICGLPVAPFKPLFGLPSEELAKHHVVRMTADAPIGYPCRVLLVDASPGDTLLLLNHEYQPARTPYRGRHAIFVNEAATEPARFFDEIPPALRIRKALSVRAFDRNDMMIDADVVAGFDVEELVLRYFKNPAIAYLHAHNAGRGCFAARIDRN